MSSPPVASGITQLREILAGWRAAGERIALVPTMGALHEGHLSLVRAAQAAGARVVVSIFVNPAQFAPNEDFAAYPRDPASDAQKLADVQTDLIFAPGAAELYPQEFSTAITMGGPAAGLESDTRPHFFGGVALVVAKLLIAAQPDIAIFGEKDYQQLLVVRRLARDLGMAVEIIGAPIQREGDGLAMSSRNVYLGMDERRIAGTMNVILMDAVTRLRTGAAIGAVEAEARDALKRAGFDAVDYVAVRDAENLEPIRNIHAPARILAAARIGRTRLIDNMAI
jgi:pantoate--beta-alanine ligase